MEVTLGCVCFRALRPQWSPPVEPSSPVTSERPSEDTTTDTQWVHRKRDFTGNIWGIFVASNNNCSIEKSIAATDASFPSWYSNGGGS